MVTVFSRFRVRNGREADMREALSRRSHRVEGAPGFLGFQVHTDADDPTVFYLESRWARRADFDAWHRSDDHAATLRAIPAGVKLDPAYTRVTVLEPAGPPAEGAAQTPLGPSVREGLAAFAATSGDLHVIVADRRGRIRQVNGGAVDWLGVPAEELMGSSLHSLVAVHDQEHLQEALEGREPMSRAMSLSLVDAAQRLYTLRGVLRVCADETVLVGSPDARDLHELQDRMLEVNNELASVAREAERRRQQLQVAKLDLQKTLDDLHESYWHLRKIQEVLPICMSCGKVKTGEARWQEVVDYLKENSLFLSHGLCPGCYQVKVRELEEWGL